MLQAAKLPSSAISAFSAAVSNLNYLLSLLHLAVLFPSEQAESFLLTVPVPCSLKQEENESPPGGQLTALGHLGDTAVKLRECMKG